MAETKVAPKSGAKAGIRAMVALAIFLGFLALIGWFYPDDLDLWLKALHVVAVMSWMAGLLYLPRLFIYHHEAAVGSESSELFKTMERRLYRIIMNPAMMIAWALGLYLAWSSFRFTGGWLHAKLLAVVLLTAAHIHFGRAVKAFGRDERPLSPRGWRLYNEVPTLLMIVIVVLVIVKPWA